VYVCVDGVCVMSVCVCVACVSVCVCVYGGCVWCCPYIVCCVVTEYNEFISTGSFGLNASLSHKWVTTSVTCINGKALSL